MRVLVTGGAGFIAVGLTEATRRAEVPAWPVPERESVELTR
jgi:nucleoside-diphosphate-sugar epimerase